MPSYQLADNDEAAGRGASCVDRLYNCRHTLQCPAVQYVEQYSNRLEDRCFPTISLPGYVTEVCDVCTSHLDDTVASKRGMSQARAAFCDGGRHPHFRMAERPCRSNHFSCPYARIYFFRNWHYWSCEVHFCYRMRAHGRITIVGCQDMELVMLPLLPRNCLYAGCPLWWERVQCYRILTVPTPPVLAYYWNDVVIGRLGTGVLCHFAALEFLTLALVPFLCAADQGVGVKCYNLRMGWGSCGVLVLLDDGVCCCVEYYGFRLLLLVAL